MKCKLHKSYLTINIVKDYKKSKKGLLKTLLYQETFTLKR